MKKKRVLITDGAGYVGSVVARELINNGYYVRVIDNLMHGGSSIVGFLQEEGFEFMLGDISDKEACLKAIKDVDYLIHLAAIVGDPACSKNQDLAKKTNLESTFSLVNLARQEKINKFIFASTCSNYGISDSSINAVEESPLNPVSLYAETKVAAEKYILENIDSSFKPTILRLSTVYGISPRMRFDLTVNDFVLEAYLNKRLTIYGEQFWRPYIYTKDVARAMILVLKEESGICNGEIFNVGDTNENYQKATIGNLTKERLKGTEITYIKKDEDPRSYKVSFEKIKNKLGFQITKTLQDGIGEVADILEKSIITDYDNKKYRN